MQSSICLQRRPNNKFGAVTEWSTGHILYTGSGFNSGLGGRGAHGSRLTAHGYRRLGGGGCGGEWAASFGIGDDVVYAAAAAGKKHGVSLRLPQRRSPRSSTDLGKTPSSRGKINLFLFNRRYVPLCGIL